MMRKGCEKGLSPLGAGSPLEGSLLRREQYRKTTNKQKNQQREAAVQEKGAEHEPDPNTPRAPAARSGSQLPTAIFPHRALEKRKREVKTSFGLCFEWIQKDYNRNCCKMHVKIIILGTKTFKISPNWRPKSMSKP